MNPLDELKFKLNEIEEKLGLSFQNKDLLILAFIHRSFLNENRDAHAHNERLEFLGDSVLSLAVTEWLYKKYPHHSEGKLSFFRSLLVSATRLAQWMEELQLGSYLLLGRGEQELKRGKESIFANTFEALLGAIFLDSSLEEVKKFLFHHFELEMVQICEEPPKNYKAELQDYLQKTYQKVPSYQVVEESGFSHAKTFRIRVLFDAQELGVGEGSSKKEAEQEAAKVALEKLRNA